MPPQNNDNRRYPYRAYLPWLTRGYSAPARTTQPTSQPYRYYLPLTSRPTPRMDTSPVGAEYAQQQGVTPGEGPQRIMGWAGRMIGHAQQTAQWITAMQEARREESSQFKPPQLPEEGAQGTAGAQGPGRAGPSYAPAPAGIDPVWYQQFQQEHGGMTPEQYYSQTGEHIGHALEDQEWAENFYRDNGRPPNEYEWRHHWFITRVGYTPEEAEEWRIRHLIREETGGGGGGDEEQRPPLYEPPNIIWR